MKKLFMVTFLLVFSLADALSGADGAEAQNGKADKVEEAVEKAVEKIAEKEAVETAEKAEQKETRPEEWWQPTKIYFMVFIIDIDKINDADQSFTANIYLKLNWVDKRLAHEGATYTISLDEIWNPRAIIANKSGGLMQTSLPEVASVGPDGSVTYRQRYTGPLSQPLNLSEFPFDSHKFTIQFVSPVHNPKEIEFLPLQSPMNPSIVGGAIYHQLSLPDWKIVDYVVESRPYEPVKDIEAAGFVFEFTAKRYVIYYIWQVIVPLVLIVMMSWGAFYIDPANVGAGIGVATSSMLTLIAYRFMLGNLIPRLPYMTRLDYFTLGSTILVFMTLMEVVVATNLVLRQKGKLSLRIDFWCRFIFPIVFLVWSYWALIA